MSGPGQIVLDSHVIPFTPASPCMFVAGLQHDAVTHHALLVQVVTDQECSLLALSLGLVGASEAVRTSYQSVKDSLEGHGLQHAWSGQQPLGISIRHVYVIVCFIVLAVMLAKQTSWSSPHVSVTA